MGILCLNRVYFRIVSLILMQSMLMNSSHICDFPKPKLCLKTAKNFWFTVNALMNERACGFIEEIYSAFGNMFYVYIVCLRSPSWKETAKTTSTKINQMAVKWTKKNYIFVCKPNIHQIGFPKCFVVFHSLCAHIHRVYAVIQWTQGEYRCLMSLTNKNVEAKTSS